MSNQITELLSRLRQLLQQSMAHQPGVVQLDRKPFLNFDTITNRQDALILIGECFAAHVPPSVGYLTCHRPEEAPLVTTTLIHAGDPNLRGFLPGGPRPSRHSEVLLLRGIVAEGATTLQTVAELRASGYKVTRVVSLLTRTPATQAAMEANKVELITLFTPTDLLH